MSSRRMRLLPRAALHSDSDQFIYNWMLEDDLDLDWGNWKEPNGREEKRKILSVVLDQGVAKKAQETKGIVMQTKSWCGFMQTKPVSHARSRSAKKAQRTKGIVMQTKVVMWIHAN